MSDTFRYRFQIILDYLEEQKQQALLRFRQCVAEREQAQQALQQAEAILRQCQTLIAQTMHKRDAFARQMLRSESGAPLTGLEIQQRLRWQEALEVDIDQAEERAKAQRAVVAEKHERLAAAEARVQQAQQELNECRLKEEAFDKHKEKAHSLFQQTLERKESIEQDDIGAILHQLRGI